MANCLVLGANGFLGSHLVDRLIVQGHFVRCFDRYPEGVYRFKPSESVEVFSGEFLNESDINNALEGIDYVFHFVSTTTPISSSENPEVEIDTNIKHSVLLFEQCVKHKVKKVIFASTGGAIYGDYDVANLSEELVPKPVSPYGIGKFTIENFLRYFNVKHGLESVSYRISNPYGPRQSPNNRQGVIAIFLNHLIQEIPITVYGDGEMVRDYIYVDDAVEMVVDSFERATSDVYNIGAGTGLSVNQIITHIEGVTNKQFKINYEQSPKTFVDRSVLDISRFENEFGKTILTSFHEGIGKTWQQIQGHVDG